MLCSRENPEKSCFIENAIPSKFVNILEQHVNKWDLFRIVSVTYPQDYIFRRCTNQIWSKKKLV